MYSYQSFYEFNTLIQEYQNKDIKGFTDKFHKIFNNVPQLLQEQINKINELLEENSNTHKYISQNLMENVADIKSSPAPEKVKNLISELLFAKNAYKEDFEKDASEIDDVENLLIEWDRLLKLNKQLCVFLFSQNFEHTKVMIEMLISSKLVLDKNIEILKPSLVSLYQDREENLKLYNSICEMTRNANRISKEY